MSSSFWFYFLCFLYFSSYVLVFYTGIQLSVYETLFMQSGLLPTTDPTSTDSEFFNISNQSGISAFFFHSEIVKTSDRNPFNRYVDFLCLKSVDMTKSSNKETLIKFTDNIHIIPESVSKNPKIFSDANFEKYWTFYGCMKHRFSLYIYILNRFLERSYISVEKEGSNLGGSIPHTKETVLYSTIENTAIGRLYIDKDEEMFNYSKHDHSKLRLLVLDLMDKYKSDFSVFDNSPMLFLTRFINQTSEVDIYKKKPTFISEINSYLGWDFHSQLGKRGLDEQVWNLEYLQFDNVMFSNRLVTEEILYWIFKFKPDLKTLWLSFYVKPTPVEYSRYQKYSKYWTFFNKNKFIVGQFDSNVLYKSMSFIPLEFILENLENVFNLVCLKLNFGSLHHYVITTVLSAAKLPLLPIKILNDYYADHLHYMTFYTGLTSLFDYISETLEIYFNDLSHPIKNCTTTKLDYCLTKRYDSLTIFSYLNTDRWFSCEVSFANISNSKHEIQTCRDLEMSLVYFSAGLFRLIWIVFATTLLILFDWNFVLKLLGVVILLSYCIFTWILVFPQFNAMANHICETCQ